MLKYGMVGGGPGSFIGDAHRKAINLDGKAILCAGCFSRNFEKSKAVAEELGIDNDRCYENYEVMAEKEAEREDKIDFVVIVTPNVSHYEIAKTFLNANINVVCDKPLCFTSKEAEELMALAKEKDLLFMVTYTYTGHVTAKHIKEYIKSGKLGKIRTIMAEYPQGWLADENDFGGKQGQWRCDPEISGEVNCLGDIGTHIENIVSFMTGLKIKRVLAKLDVVVKNRSLDDNDVVMLEYEDGATGVYWCSQFALGHDNDLKVRIYGENGSIIWRQEESEKVLIADKDGAWKEIHRGNLGIDEKAAAYSRLPSGHPEGYYEAMANLYLSFINCVDAKNKGEFTEDMIDFPTVYDGVQGVKFIEACLKSSRNGNVWVEV